MKAAYGCPGISTCQHNEPAGGQDVWHFHVHVFPRYLEDNLYLQPSGRLTVAKERCSYAERRVCVLVHELLRRQKPQRLEPWCDVALPGILTDQQRIGA